MSRTRKTKSDLVQELADLGETAPKAWTMPELESRILEIHEAAGSVRSTGKEPTPLRHMMIEMNKASKLKANPMSFMENQLRMSPNKNDTIPILQKKAIMKCYQITMASPEDPVGFGQHCQLQYQELVDQDPQYCQWVIQTSKEDSADYRLMRLAEWLEKNLEGHPNSTTSKGYKKTEKKKLDRKGTTSASSSTSKETTQMMAMMTQMAGMLSTLQEEVENLKEARPRKKTVEPMSDVESEATSFTPVNL